MDFVLRDAYMSGYSAKVFDLDRLLHYSVFTPRGLTIHERGLSALADIEPQIPRIPYRNGDRLRGFLLECLSRKVDERPATMVEFQRRLNQWVLES